MPMPHHPTLSAMRQFLSPSPPLSLLNVCYRTSKAGTLIEIPSLAERQWQPSALHQKRYFHQTCTRATFRPVWTERRVKVPWVEALAKKRAEESQLNKAKEKAEGVVSSGKADMTPKRMSDSYFRTILPLAQDPWLLDTYLNATGHIRLGSLLMDLDALAGVVGYKHTGDNVTMVTAAVDRIVIENPLKEICDLELSGQVTYATGRSSVEVSLQVARAPANESQEIKKEDVLITCAFTMVSLGSGQRRKERRLFEKGEQNYTAKKSLRSRSLRLETPNDEESDLIHAMWIRELAYKDPENPIARPKNVIPMQDTTLRSAQIMQPQYRNRHNFMIFGGFLLKQTFELAFCCAASFSHSRPTFLSLDPSTFDNPVPVGSVLYLKAVVSYTDPPLASTESTAGAKDRKFTKVQVRVDSSVRDVSHGAKKPTGVFNYTFLVEQDMQVMPRSYGDFMVWVDARRRAHATDKSLPEWAARMANGAEGWEVLGEQVREGVTE
ncbi:conserved hypothetical protein [Uncinocarpus reesii 1704]|uniref:HotDog ACOT-type domain-containing protein n=1 Tax=Uncinocarpus reesii (strain UAMH 1704) TaxID=336963 RepID=C4JSZ3_UNCRE|nr:uncharacterized protein UREG_05582 [Uncinocarpus reesii 1704]EEP80740.1 conserved hypothetical protein [Uncinocarpus reesii 1704]